MGVPFVDLRSQYRSIQSEVQAAIGEVLEQTAFVLGPAVERFERDFASYLGTDHVLGRPVDEDRPLSPAEPPRSAPVVGSI